VQDIEEYACEDDQKSSYHLLLPILRYLPFGQSISSGEKTLHMWRKSGVLTEDVLAIEDHGRVALIECELQDAFKIQDTFRKL
jgi:hypothetical protein